MSADAAAGSLSFVLDFIPVLVIVILIIAFAVGRHRFLKEKRELDATITECEKNMVKNTAAELNGPDGE